jgi:hypothetical protein
MFDKFIRCALWFSSADRHFKKLPEIQWLLSKIPSSKPSGATRGSPSQSERRFGSSHRLSGLRRWDCRGISASKRANRPFLIDVNHNLKALKKFGERQRQFDEVGRVVSARSDSQNRWIQIVRLRTPTTATFSERSKLSTFQVQRRMVRGWDRLR